MIEAAAGAGVGVVVVLTVSVAALLVALPTELLTTTSNLDPLSEAAVGGVPYVADVAPAIFTAFLCHW